MQFSIFAKCENYAKMGKYFSIFSFAKFSWDLRENFLEKGKFRAIFRENKNLRKFDRCRRCHFLHNITFWEYLNHMRSNVTRVETEIVVSAFSRKCSYFRELFLRKFTKITEIEIMWTTWGMGHKTEWCLLNQTFKTLFFFNLAQNVLRKVNYTVKNQILHFRESFRENFCYFRKFSLT
jgi:hypothetical protein